MDRPFPHHALTILASAVIHPLSVIPAQAGIHLTSVAVREMDSRLRGNDERGGMAYPSPVMPAQAGIPLFFPPIAGNMRRQQAGRCQLALA